MEVSSGPSLLFGFITIGPFWACLNPLDRPSAESWGILRQSREGFPTHLKGKVMAELDSLYDDIVSFYRGWHQMEMSGTYTDGCEIIDQDYYQPPTRRDSFTSRRDRRWTPSTNCGGDSTSIPMQTKWFGIT